MGWARAQLIFDKMSAPPRYGSLLELMCLTVQRERASLALLGARAQAQAAIGGEAAEAAFKEYVNAASRVELANTKKKMHDQIEELKKIKEIRFQPLTSTTKQLRLRVVDGQKLQDQGFLSDQFSLTKPTTPVRARNRRGAR